MGTRSGEVESHGFKFMEFAGLEGFDPNTCKWTNPECNGEWDNDSEEASTRGPSNRRESFNLPVPCRIKEGNGLGEVSKPISDVYRKIAPSDLRVNNRYVSNSSPEEVKELVMHRPLKNAKVKTSFPGSNARSHRIILEGIGISDGKRIDPTESMPSSRTQVFCNKSSNHTLRSSKSTSFSDSISRSRMIFPYASTRRRTGDSRPPWCNFFNSKAQFSKKHKIEKISLRGNMFSYM